MPLSQFRRGKPSWLGDLPQESRRWLLNIRLMRLPVAKDTGGPQTPTSLVDYNFCPDSLASSSRHSCTLHGARTTRLVILLDRQLAGGIYYKLASALWLVFSPLSKSSRHTSSTWCRA